MSNSPLKLFTLKSTIFLILYAISVVCFQTSFPNININFISFLIVLLFPVWRVIKKILGSWYALLTTAVLFWGLHIFIILNLKLPLYWISVMYMNLSPLKVLILNLFCLFCLSISDFLGNINTWHAPFFSTLAGYMIIELQKIQNIPQVSLRIENYPLGIIMTSLSFALIVGSYLSILKAISASIISEFGRQT